MIRVTASACIVSIIGRVGKAPPPRTLYFFSVKQKLNVFRKVIIVLVTMTYYKQSMKNVQSFHVIRILTKITFVLRTQRPHGWGKMPPNLTKQFAINI